MPNDELNGAAKMLGENAEFVPRPLK